MKLLYLGDNAGSSAEYLKDCLGELEYEVTHYDSQTELKPLSETYDCIIVSDYPASQLTKERASEISEQVAQGTRFIMLGGWDSFNGRGTNYANHPLAELLPVKLQQEDDRVNTPQGMVLVNDPALSFHLPLDWQNPPVLCGYNSVETKESSQVLVWIRPIQTDGTSISLLERIPFVIKGRFRQGTTIACTTDLAPHWCGGLVDWGSERRTLPHVEVGDMYLNFIQLLLSV